MSDTGAVCVVGIGNPDCGDDSAGPEVIDRLEAQEIQGVKTLKASGETAGLIELLGQSEKVILIDAVAAVTEPGTIHRFDAGENPLPSEWFANYSTHSMGVHEAVEMARVLGELPATTIVYGIEGTCFEAGDSLSSAVLNNLDELVTQVKREISTLNPKT